jgi:hypothetical protein
MNYIIWRPCVLATLKNTRVHKRDTHRSRVARRVLNVVWLRARACVYYQLQSAFRKYGDPAFANVGVPTTHFLQYFEQAHCLTI